MMQSMYLNMEDGNNVGDDALYVGERGLSNMIYIKGIFQISMDTLIYNIHMYMMIHSVVKRTRMVYITT